MTYDRTAKENDPVPSLNRLSGCGVPPGWRRLDLLEQRGHGNGIGRGDKGGEEQSESPIVRGIAGHKWKLSSRRGRREHFNDDARNRQRDGTSPDSTERRRRD